MQSEKPAVAVALPAEPPRAASRWTPQAVIGLLCLVGAVILRRVLGEHGPEVADGLSLLGGSLVGWAPPLPPIKPGGGPGGAWTGLGVGLLLATLAMLAPGCGTSPRVVQAEQSVRLQVQEGPPCAIVLTADGELVARVDWVHRCELPAPVAPAPAVTP